MTKTKTKFKHTEIGWIPEDWEIKKIKDIGKIITGGTPSTKNKNYWNGEYIWVTPTDISNKKIIYQTERNISKKAIELLGELPVGTVLVTCIASIGKNAILGKIGACNQQINAIIPNSNYDSEFLYYLFENSKSYLQGFSSITATSIISKSLFEKIRFQFPPLHEQQAIAEVLSDIDTLIDKMDKLIQKKINIKNATMHLLLSGKKRLPGFKGDWVKRKLGMICKKIDTGKLDANAMNPDGIYPFFTCAKEHFYIDFYSFDTEAILISGNGENVGYVHYYKGKFNAYQRTYVLHEFEENIFYIKYYLEKYLKERIKIEVKAGNTPYIVKDTLKEMEIFFPSNKSEQQAIAQVLSDMDKEIDALQKRKNKLTHIKQSAMHLLLTGKVRLIHPSQNSTKTKQVSQNTTNA
ncbi:MAG TPA: restriction endonuclease subunit S [Bacteroidia bacterium]|nr:restriction endonuclease subunit S [Bacteroidia bacterium]